MSTPSRSPIITIQKMIRWDVVMLGIGLFVFIFVSSLFHANKRVLRSAESRWNNTLLEIHDLYIEATRSHRECLEDNSHILELSELRGRLEGHQELAQKYNFLLEEYQRSTHELQKVRTELDLNKEQKEELLQQVQELVEENSETLRGLEHFDIAKRHLQHRHNVLCKQKYNLGPYYVGVTFSIQGQERMSYFVVELSSRKYMPHSVYTFLSLVESKLFDGFSITSSADSLQIEPNKKADSTTSNILRAYGYGESALSFMESSSMFPCTEYSVGFVGLGSKLRLLMSEDDGSHDDIACFGSIIRGISSLSLLQTELLKGSTATIVEMKYLDL